MKTFNGWTKGDFDEYVNPKEEIDEEMYDYFLGVLPPRVMKGYGFLVGEPHSHNSQGHAVYSAFYQSPNGKQFYYGGHKTVKEFTDPNDKKYTL